MREGEERDRKGERVTGREREREREETVDAVFVRHEQSAKKKKTAEAADEELFPQKRGKRWPSPPEDLRRRKWENAYLMRRLHLNGYSRAGFFSPKRSFKTTEK